MRILVACELSGVVRRAFLDRGHDAWSCDLPTPQKVQPYWFGDPEYKSTSLYLRGLPALKETNRLAEPEKNTDEWKRWNRVHRMPPGPERAKERSRFFPGIAAAMAEQWGALETVSQEVTA